VVRHAAIERDRARAVARRDCAEISLARIARDWSRLPQVAVPASDTPLAAARASDLDVDGEESLMAFAGALTSSSGRRVLRGWMVDEPEPLAAIHSRQEAARALARCADFREAFAAEVRLGEAERDQALARARFLAWAVAPPSVLSRPAVRWIIRVWTALLLISITGAILSGTPLTQTWVALSLGAFALSYIATARLHGEFDGASLGPTALGNLVSMLKLAESIPAKAERLDAVGARLCRPVSASAALESLARRVGWSELRRTAPILHVPLQALTLWDFHLLFALDDWRAASGAHVEGWLEAVAELDALLALGTLAHDEPSWSFPLIEDAAAPHVTADALGHPLIAPGRRVSNDAALGPPGTVLLVTGSNMAGKSTLLRAFGTNILLANAGAPVCATHMTLTRLVLATSLRTGDSLAQGVSGYMAGLVRLKEIVDAGDRVTAQRANAAEAPALCYLLDEILAGTNSEERRLAVREIAAHLLSSHAVGAMTTHDLALADEPALASATRVHFRETVEPGSDGAKMTFDYVLRPGLATSTNAIALLRAVGLTQVASRLR
nr:hypothetical protein [Acidobacteriota bacterium]